MPVMIVGTKTDKFLKLENTEGDLNSQQKIIHNQIEAFRRIYEEKVNKVQLEFVFVSQGKYYPYCYPNSFPDSNLTCYFDAQTTNPRSEHCFTPPWAPLSMTECTEP